MVQEGKNALIDKRYRWTFPIPYILGDDLGKSETIYMVNGPILYIHCISVVPYGVFIAMLRLFHSLLRSEREGLRPPGF